MQHRQPDLSLIFENVHDPHNIAAVLRSADAVGVQEVYILDTRNTLFSKLGKKSSSSASKWLDIHHFRNTKECFAAVREKYKRIASTRLSEGSVDLYDLNLSDPIALVFGNEHEGVSEEAAALSDFNFIIPQVGMIQSLNISVACAVTLYEAYRQRSLKGHYKQSRLSDAAFQTALRKWSGLAS